MNELLDLIGRAEGPLAYLALAASAALEYVFPPFPGDMVTLFGAFLVTARGWSVVAVTAAVTVGSLLGATVDYGAGVWLAGRPLTPPRTWAGRALARARVSAEPLVAAIRARGAAFIVVNRFLPGVRALFFVAAGMARLPLRAVLAWGALSTLLWNGALIAAGTAVGASWERLVELFRAYATAAWVVVAAVVVVAVAVRLHRRRRRRRTTATNEATAQDATTPPVGD